MKITKQLLHYIAAAAGQFGILDKIAYRNLCWKIEYEEKMSVENHQTVEIELRVMADKYNTSFETMRRVCYPNGEAKPQADEIISLFKITKTKKRRVHPNRRRK